jgi:hypothetical protein
VWAQDESGAQNPQTSPAGGAPQTQQKKHHPWNVWENKAFSVTFIFTPLFDVSGFVQDANSKEQVGPQPTKGEFRAESDNICRKAELQTAMGLCVLMELQWFRGCTRQSLFEHGCAAGYSRV